MKSKNNIYYDIKNCEQTETLVLLHGNGEDHHIYDEFITYFNDYKIILIDSRLHGESSKELNKVTLDNIVDDIIEILDETHTKKASFVGFSDGGNLCLLLALIRSDLVKSMVIMGANYNVFGLKTNYILMNYFSYGLYALLGLFSHKYKLKQKVTRLMTFEPNLKKEDIQQIKTKTLIITAKKDCIRLKHSERLNALMTNSKLVLIKDSSHYFLIDNLKETTNQIRYFLNS